MEAASQVQVQVNGELRRLEPGATVSHLLASLQLGTQRVAVERNGELVPRSRHADTVLADGDRVEIVRAIGGG